MSEYHIPVLLDRSVSALIGDTDGIYADATFGGGGHSSEILRRLGPKGQLIAFDRDEDALENKIDDQRFTLIHNNFRFIHNYSLLHFGQKGLDGILADLGVSSHQFDTAQRGFSFRYSAALDMRMNTSGDKTAEDIVNDYSQEDLENIFKIFGEVDNARKVASLIVSSRSRERISTTDRLNDILAPALPPFAEHKYLAKVYQALRIEVNQEMRALEKFLQGATQSLKKGGKLVIITYQSLEDRMVKNFIKCGNIDGRLEKDIYGNVQSPLVPVNRKPILPLDAEIAINTRARSAKLRIAIKK